MATATSDRQHAIRGLSIEALNAIDAGGQWSLPKNPFAAFTVVPARSRSLCIVYPTAGSVSSGANSA